MAYDYSTPTKKKNDGLVYAMTGTNPAFNYSIPNSTLPSNYNFSDLASYEEKARRQYGKGASADILNTRDQLSSSLNDYGQKFFEQQNPAMLEDLNARGLLTSPSEVANKSAQALKEIALSNENYLRDFDTAALSARLQAEQDALDSASNLRSTGLEQARADANSASERSLAEKLGKDQNRNNLYGALIGAGGSIAGGSLPYLLGKGAATKAAATAAGTAGTAAAGTAGTTAAGTAGTTAAGTGTAGTGIGLGTAAGVAGGAAGGLAAYEETRKALANEGINKSLAKVGGSLPLIGAQVVGANKIVSALGGGAGHTENGNAIAATAGSLQEQRGQLGEIKNALDSGQIDQATYDEYTLPILKNYHKMVDASLRQGSVWASSITPEWNALLQSGTVRADGNRWVTNTGKVIWDPQKGWDA